MAAGPPRARAGGLTDLHWSAIIFLCAAVFGLADITMFQFVPGRPAGRARGQAAAIVRRPAARPAIPLLRRLSSRR